AGMEAVFLARFNAAFAGLSPQAFVADILAGQLGASHIVTGYNFAFGKGRGGDTAFLAQAAEKCGISGGMGFTACAQVTGPDGEAVSSSAIRAHLQAGRVRQAAALLGRDYAIEGRVIHGDKRGRELGWPTANITLGKLFLPAYGVYAVRLEMDGGETYDGVANFGIRPMFAVEAPLLEVHAFGLERAIYGQRVRVAMVDYLREERYFDTLDGLKAQIEADAQAARRILTGPVFLKGNGA
ncbi:MAG: riboflavin biosynthesis protein RibF, partial [Rickettsiales bacterium]|nr:riboflavin biosynthesis protein RibF [Rickettsiales bacterium]